MIRRSVSAFLFLTTSMWHFLGFPFRLSRSIMPKTHICFLLRPLPRMYLTLNMRVSSISTIRPAPPSRTFSPFASQAARLRRCRNTLLMVSRWIFGSSMHIKSTLLEIVSPTAQKWIIRSTISTGFLKSPKMTHRTHSGSSGNLSWSNESSQYDDDSFASEASALTLINS